MFLFFVEMRMNIVKRLPTLCAALLCLLLSCAFAQESGIDVKIDAQRITYAFTLEDEQYAYVQVTTKNDIGKQLLYSENGSFTGSMTLPNCYEATQVTIDVMRPNGRRVYRHTDTTLEVISTDSPAPQDESVRAVSKAYDVVVTAAEDGFNYSFNVPGRAEVYLRVKSGQETHTSLLYAESNYSYAGHVALPLTFAESAVTFTILTTNSNHKL